MLPIHIVSKFLASEKWSLTFKAKTSYVGGSEIIIKGGERKSIVRGALQVDFSIKTARSDRTANATRRHLKDSLFSVLCTHLDHICEYQRIVQLDHISELISTPDVNLTHEDSTKLNSSDPPALIVGDLNALNKDDYSHEEWKTLEQRHEKNNWYDFCMCLLLYCATQNHRSRKLPDFVFVLVGPVIG